MLDASGAGWLMCSVDVFAMLRFISFLLASGLFTSCTTRPLWNEVATPPPQRGLYATHSYSVGMTRKELRAEFADSWLVAHASRPVGGWSELIYPLYGNSADRFERRHQNTIVDSCDVYWVGHTNAPRIQEGIWLDYFLFDRNEKLVGFDKRVID